jgi:hypothetical protein
MFVSKRYPIQTDKMFRKQQKLPVVSIIFDKQYNVASTHIILPLQSQYIFSLLTFVAKNKDSFKTNSDIHSFNTRFNHDLYIPIANLAVFKKGVWYSGTKFITISHQLLNNYYMMLLNLKQL